MKPVRQGASISRYSMDDIRAVGANTAGRESLNSIDDMTVQFFSCKLPGKERTICGVCALAKAELLQSASAL